MLTYTRLAQHYHAPDTSVIHFQPFTFRFPVTFLAFGGLVELWLPYSQDHLPMKKRTFLKTSSAMITGSLLAPAMTYARDSPRKNWAGNLTYSTDNLYQPQTVAQVREMVKQHDKLRALGTCHSFNRIADSTENQLSLKKLSQAMSLNHDTHTVTVDAGVRYGELAVYLQKQGFALHNLASLPHISIAGACATATHGSGDQNGNLATAVAALEVVTANGEMITLSREADQEQFQGAVVGLGGLEVVTKVTLDVEPTYEVRQDIYRDLPLAALKEHFEAIMASGYSVSLFTDWSSDTINQIWVKSRIEHDKTWKAEPELFGATLATRNLHPIAEVSAEHCTEQLGVPGPWHERLPHFRLDFTPSSGEELQSEYFVPRQHAVDAILAVQRLSQRIVPQIMISEVRSIAADDYWMSPCYRQSCVALHFTWKQNWPAVQKLLPVIEEQLEPYEVRPHWGKLFTMAPTRLQSRYSQLDQFKQLLQQHDPKGKFRNAFLEEKLYRS